MTICDTHIHFYDDRSPTAPTATLRPPNATIDDYAKVQAALGIERMVVVQPTTYGLDNRCQLDAVRRLGDRARAIVVVDSTIDASALREFANIGVRGARFHMLPGGAVGWDHLEPVAERIAAFGWHIQLQLDGHQLAKYKDRLLQLKCPLVIDHVGRFMGPVEPDSQPFLALLDLVDAGAYVKLSAPYESAPDDAHHYEVVTRCIDTLVRRAPDRMLWATNWPHPGQLDPPTNDDLLRLRDRWLPTEELRHRVLVANPARLYGFSG